MPTFEPDRKPDTSAPPSKPPTPQPGKRYRARVVVEAAAKTPPRMIPLEGEIAESVGRTRRYEPGHLLPADFPTEQLAELLKYGAVEEDG